MGLACAAPFQSILHALECYCRCCAVGYRVRQRSDRAAPSAHAQAIEDDGGTGAAPLSSQTQGAADR